MSTVQVARRTRRQPPPVDTGDFQLQEPPGLPEATGSNFSGLLMYLPMMVGSGAMMMFFVQPGQNPVMMYMSAGIMGVALLVMGGAMVMRAGTDRKIKMRSERRDYLRYLGQVRKQVRRSIDRQRESVLFTHPDPGRLWAVVPTERLWERRPNHADFAEVRIGLGQQRLSLQLKAPQTKPVADLEPLCASALRRFLRAYTLVEDMPIAVYLRGFARISLDGEVGLNRAMARAIIAQASTFHASEDLKVAVFAGADRLRHWDWVKWLPHAQHADQFDAAGSCRLVSDDWDLLETLFGGKEFEERARFEPGAIPTASEPFVILVLDGALVPSNHRLAGPGYRNLVTLDVDGAVPWDGAATTLRLRIKPDRMEKVSVSRLGEQETVLIGRPDGLSLVRARAFARLAAPFRLSGGARPVEASSVSTDLASLLGIADLRGMDPTALWQSRTVWDHLRVPIGVSDNGQPLELDLKESAQGGMGPHGILIGATGSGKSELIRTLVLSLALTHSSEKLNMVLVDFKGGATFLGLDGLPHVSALITNLADELPLVDRMQDALQGELNRRQELLRQTKHTSIHEYERARAGGAKLKPLPTLVVIVDEFGELLATKGEFVDLFMMIGRLGRSLGVHLLLASQRFEEGRIHTLETHLSYRLGLRMFSAMESRSVIGTGDAYEQPLQPGTGYLRTDTTTLVRFRAAYSSGPCAHPGKRRVALAVNDARIVPFELNGVFPVRRPEPEPVPETAADTKDQGIESVLQVIVDRLRDSGPPAHRVWLPPLDEPTTLDAMLPPLTVDAERGFGAPYGGLRVPVALVDRPYDQRRDVLFADLDGAKGHVAVVGAPRTGKSTVIRTLVAGLALTHTPREVQFYIIDFGGGSMVTLADLPHVGGVAQRREADRVTRTVAEIAALMDYREEFFARHGLDSMSAYRRARASGRFADEPLGDVFLVIDGWFTMRQDYDKLEQQLQDVATRGLSYGIHLIVAAGRWSEIRPWLRDVLQSRFELRLGDPMESEMDFRRAKDVPEIPGRGMTAEKYHYLCALPRIDGRSSTDDVGEALTALVTRVREHWTGPGAPGVRLLPHSFPASALPAVPADGELRVPFALEEQRLEPVWHDFGETPHLLIFGDSESGKTNLLRLMAQAITRRFTPAEAQIVLADPRRRIQDVVPTNQLVGYAMTSPALRDLLQRGVPVMKERLPGTDITPDRLSKRDWWTGPRLFVLIDDYDMISGLMDYPGESLVELLAQSGEIGLHIVVARSTSNTTRGMTDPMIRRMWDLGNPGVLLSCPREEGSFLGDAKPLKLPPGRAQLVHRRAGVRMVQLGLADGSTGQPKA
jgi:S-DNA-T family DNA segregation ATPase FtsK/SpoIIIE